MLDWLKGYGTAVSICVAVLMTGVAFAQTLKANNLQERLDGERKLVATLMEKSSEINE